MVNPQNPSSPGMIARLIALCANKPGITLVLVLLAAIWGGRSLLQVPLDAIPDLSDAQVIVFTEWDGRSPDLVEDQITYPLTTALLGVPNVRFVRGQSFMGLSFVYVIFEDDTDIYWARSRVLEYLNTASQQLPEGVSPTLGPDATGVGWVFQYALVDKSGKHDLADLRALQDFKLRYWLTAVEGVAEVASVGGFEKEYQVNVDPDRLASFDVPLRKVVEAIRRSNNDVGGRVLEIAGHEHFIRGGGYLQSKDDLRDVVIGVDANRIPIRLEQVANISLGPAMQRGLAELDGEGQTVGGIVVMRYGENALAVIERVKQRLEDVQAGLPEGVEVVTTYDRSNLIQRAIDTLTHTLIVEMVVVALVIFAFLLHVRSALVACITLPIAILLAFIPLKAQGLTANIMSLGGIAVAIGAMVDAAVVMVDNIHKRLGAREEGDDSKALIISAMQDVGPSIFFSLLIITLSFIPVFSRRAAVLAAGLYQDLQHGLCGHFGGDLDTGFGSAVDPRSHPLPQQSGQPGAGNSVPARHPLLYPLALAGGGAVGAGPGSHRASGPATGQRVHAAAQRGQHSLHAHGPAGHVGHRGGPGAATDGQAAQGVSRSGAGVWQGGAFLQRHRPGAPVHGGNRDHP